MIAEVSRLHYWNFLREWKLCNYIVCSKDLTEILNQYCVVQVAAKIALLIRQKVV